ncbi:YolD-like family protein [Exiguobacterium sp. s80]|uniref:YolD-like family protein n=1 Tax=Exiguobacterium sp. s80 TaxID=2751209 RepID=UPI001BE9D73E|nr:YolD-like family protein [Exiguobacterium sp. s80]
MTRYVDRGNLKWIPFLTLEHKTILKQYYREVHQLDVPNYDERLDPQIENVLNDAIFNRGLLRIVAHHNGIEFKFDAYVEKLDYKTDTITLRKTNYQEEKVRFD